MIKRTIKLSTLLALALTFSIIFYIGATLTGLKVTLSVIEHFAPGQLKIDTVSGSLASYIRIDRLRYHNKNLTVSANNITLKLQLLSLLWNRLTVSYFHVSNLKIVNKPVKSKTTNAPPSFNLPLGINLDDIDINYLDYSNGIKQQIIRHLIINAGIGSNRVDLDKLYAEYNNAEYIVNGLVNLDPLNISLHFAQQKKQDTTIAGKISARGNWKKITLHSELNIPVKITADGSIFNLFTKPEWMLNGTINNIFVSKQEQYEGTFKGAGGIKKLQLESDWTSTKNKHGAFKIKISSKDISKQKFNIEANWYNIFLPTQDQNQIISPIGELKLNGAINNYSLTTNMILRGKFIPHANVIVNAQGNRNQLNVSQINIFTMNGTLDGNGKLSWKNNLNYFIKLHAEELHTDTKWVNFPSSLSFNLLAMRNNGNTNYTMSNLAGTVNKAAVSGNVVYSQRKSGSQAASVDISAGNSYIHSKLTKNNVLNINWDINIDKFRDLAPILAGSLVSTGQLYKNSNSVYRIQGNASGSDLSIENYQIGKLSSDFLINTDTDKDTIINLKSSNININGYSFDQFNLQTEGKNPNHIINVMADGLDSKIDLNLNADYKNYTWYLRMPRFNLISKSFGSWRLHKIVHAEIADKDFTIKDFDWGSQTRRAKLNISVLDHTLTNANIRLNNFSLEILNNFLPEKLRLYGMLNVLADYNLEQGLINSKLNVDMSRSRILYYFKRRMHQLNLKRNVISATINDNNLTSSIDLLFNQNDFIKLNLSMDDFNPNKLFDPQQKIEGRIQTNINSLEFINPFMPVADTLSGKFTANMAWNGNVNRPNLKGSASLHNGNLVISNQGVNIRKLNLQINALKSEINYFLDANSGKGTIKIKGKSQQNNNFDTELNISGNNFEIDNTPSYHITVTPNLTAKLSSKHLDINGSLYIPMALINLMSYSNVTTLPNDVEIIRSTQEDSNQSLLDNLYTKIHLKLGKNIQLKTKMISANLAGDLQLQDTPTTEPTANGELTIVKGDVTAFGQKLTIENGKLLYAGGPTTNPGLNIKAEKKITTYASPISNTLAQKSLTSNSTVGTAQLSAPFQRQIITVGVSVSNTLKEPHILLYSDQANLSRADILSYLLLGYPLSQASGQQGEALIQAASALGSSGGGEMSGIISDLKDTFQLNEISVQSSNYVNTSTNTIQQNTSLILGKMLSPSLYIRYSIGLVIPVDTISATYSFSNNWSLKTESNTLGNGVDLIYSWEND